MLLSYFDGVKCVNDDHEDDVDENGAVVDKVDPDHGAVLDDDDDDDDDDTCNTHKLSHNVQQKQCGNRAILSRSHHAGPKCNDWQAMMIVDAPQHEDRFHLLKNKTTREHWAVR